MSLALCPSCQRFGRPRAKCVFCGAAVGAPIPRPKRAARNEILAATAAITLACGGGTTLGDGGMMDDGAVDAKADAVVDGSQNQDASADTGSDSADSGADVREEDNWLPPPPYGSPPIPTLRVV